ncbi:MAG: hypothetical protein Q9163_003138 [Psora crenata]
MTSTHTLLDGEKPEHAYAPCLHHPKTGPSPTHSPSTAPDIAYKKEPGENTINDDEERQEKPNPDDEKSDEYPSGLRLVFIVLALVLGIFLVSFDLVILATAIPKITSGFHGLDEVSWYTAAFFMMIGGFQSAWEKPYKDLLPHIHILSSSSAPSFAASPPIHGAYSGADHRRPRRRGGYRFQHLQYYCFLDWVEDTAYVRRDHWRELCTAAVVGLLIGGHLLIKA